MATPLHRGEIEDPKLAPGRFTMSSIIKRLAEIDQWAGLGRHRHGLGPLPERLQGTTG
ncbi:hypothetical protein [Actinoallomurus acaciae]|uniref:Uncharacterized protein n=1 Tax=Actinoallomurus acaciae TaxID=502577 RepID=A0ABV5Y7T2_9ACTN